MFPSWDCLCAGIVVADFVCDPLDMLPPAGALHLTDRITFTVGGCASNVAVDLARLGVRVGLSGCVGEDLFGRALRETMVASGVDCSQLVTLAGQPTSSTMIVNVRHQDRRFIHCVGANAGYDGTSISDEDLARTRILYLGGYCLLDALSPERVVSLFQRARRAGVMTLLDVVISSRSDCWEWVAPVLPWTDVFLPNNDEAERITGLTDPVEQAERCRSAGAGTVVITCGREGAVCLSPDRRLWVGTYPVPTVDPTGSGDAFVAGVIHGLLERRPLGEVLTWGTALGASCVQSVGATTGVFTRQELTQFVAANPLEVRALSMN